MSMRIQYRILYLKNVAKNNHDEIKEMYIKIEFLTIIVLYKI